MALDMGLGKTLIGCVWSRAFQQTFPNLQIFVVCPTTLRADWKRTAEEATGIHVLGGKKKKEAVDDPPTYGMTISSWAKVPTPNTLSETTPMDHFVAVFDEAHSMQSMDADRTKKALQLVKDKRYVHVVIFLRAVGVLHC